MTRSQQRARAPPSLLSQRERPSCTTRCPLATLTARDVERANPSGARPRQRAAGAPCAPCARGPGRPARAHPGIAPVGGVTEGVPARPHLCSPQTRAAPRARARLLPAAGGWARGQAGAIADGCDCGRVWAGGCTGGSECPCAALHDTFYGDVRRDLISQVHSLFAGPGCEISHPAARFLSRYFSAGFTTLNFGDRDRDFPAHFTKSPAASRAVAWHCPCSWHPAVGEPSARRVRPARARRASPSAGARRIWASLSASAGAGAPASPRPRGLG